MSEEARDLPTLRKGQRLWIVVADRTMSYAVEAVTYQQERSGTHFVRRTLEVEGKGEVMVVDRRPEELYRSYKDAVLEAVRRSRESARRHQERADQLLASLAK
jgi:hypothetical protein